MNQFLKVQLNMSKMADLIHLFLRILMRQIYVLTMDYNSNAYLIMFLTSHKKIDNIGFLS